MFLPLKCMAMGFGGGASEGALKEDTVRTCLAVDELTFSPELMIIP